MINRLHPVRLTPRQRKAGFPPYLRERTQFLSPLGLPCQKPPYGTVSAIDQRTGKLRWQVPAGTVQYGRGRLKLSLPFPIGLPTLGPSLVTSGGVLFFAGTQDPFLRAYDTSTGRELWKGRLPLASQGGPITYVSPRTGRQYVVVTAGGAAASFDRGDYLVAFALPQRDTARTNSPARNGQDE